MRYEAEETGREVLRNKKWAGKVLNAKNRDERHKRAHNFVVTAAQKLHVRLSADEINEAAYYVITNCAKAAG